MPIYEYVCSECGKINDVLQKVNDPAPEKCEACGKEKTLTRVVSRTSFVLKGGGWYSDLYSSTKKDGSGGGSKASAASSPSTSEPAKAAAPAASSAPASDAKKS